MSASKVLVPLFQLFLYGQKFTKSQLAKIRLDLIEILTWCRLISSSETDKVMSRLSLADDSKAIEQPPEVLFLCTTMLGERFLDSFKDLERLRRIIINFLLKSDPPLISPDEIRNTFLIISKSPNEEYSHGFYCFYDAFLVIMSPSLVPRAEESYLVIGANEKDSLLENGGGPKIERKFYADCNDGGYFCLLLKVEEGLSGGENDEEDNFSEEKPGDYFKDKSVSGKKLINLIFGGELRSRSQNRVKVSSPASGSELVIPEGVESPGIIELKNFLEKSIIGQDRAIKEVVRALNIAKAGIFPPQRPLLVQFWAGPTGVGKTEMAISIANFIWEREKELINTYKSKGLPPPFTEKDIAMSPLVRIDCGMFGGSLSHGVANLIGSPAGYVGSKGSQRNPQPPLLNPSRFPPGRLTVLLFDEFEKAIQNSRDNGAEIVGILMNILDKGELRNNWDEIVSFHNTIIIFTSNIGSTEIIKEALESGIGFEVNSSRRSERDVEILNARIYEVVKKKYEEVFPPEFRSRIHRLIVFRFLSDDDYFEIIKKEFGDIKQQIKKEWRVDIELTEAAVRWLLFEIHTQEGVRKLRDLMYREIVEPLARAYNLGLLWPVTYLVDVEPARESGLGEVKLKAKFLVK